MGHFRDDEDVPAGRRLHRRFQRVGAGERMDNETRGAALEGLLSDQPNGVRDVRHLEVADDGGALRELGDHPGAAGQHEGPVDLYGVDQVAHLVRHPHGLPLVRLVERQHDPAVLSHPVTAGGCPCGYFRLPLSGRPGGHQASHAY